MLVRRPSASQLQRALDCPASCWLDLKPGADEQSPAAARGTRFHKGIERAYHGGRMEDCLACVRPYEQEQLRRAIDLRPRLDPIPGLPFVEVECWYDPHLAVTMLGVPAPCHHANPDPPPSGYARGTGDLIGTCPAGMVGVGPDGGPMDMAGLPVVADHKFGSPRHQTRADESAQLAYFANWLFIQQPVLCAEGVARGVYLGQSGSFMPWWMSVSRILAFQQRMADLWGVLDLAEADQLDPADPKYLTCQPKSSHFCGVACCKKGKS